MRSTTLSLTTNKKNGAVIGGSIFFDKKVMHVNHVNLIGKVTSAPRFYETENGRSVVQLSISTQETYLDADGQTKKRTHWHRVVAWGRWVKVIEELVNEGMELAVEGKLTTRFYVRDGIKQFISEVEVNDLVII